MREGRERALDLRLMGVGGGHSRECTPR
jgi:hypothetical protein